ncbi:hypothetical protein JCM10908_001476 [Rhodotorula pacifica]|uniref:uncharacterized protein n=1 Tax=Rhodotorula pacifica TaxID=1495444 RepID=UPI0031732CE4
MSPSLHLHAPHHHHHNNTATASSSYANASPKGQHYATTLDTIRRLALWNSPAPALAKGAVNWNAASSGVGSGIAAGTGGMDWNEVLRKFRKHTPSRLVTAATAATERTLHSLLAKTAAQLRPPASATSNDFPPPPLPPRIASADRPAASNSLSELQNILKSAQGASPIEVDSARIVLAFGKWAIADSDEALAGLATVSERGLPSADGGPSEPYDMTLRVLAYAVEGYALESLGRTAEALAAYIRAGELYEAALDALASTPDRDSHDVSLHRIGGDVLMRVALVTRPSLSKVETEGENLDTSYSAHRAYLQHSSSFARAEAAFPASVQITLLRSFRSLQALLPPSRRADDSALISQLDRAQERILRRTTRLPKAGETNREYLRFLDEVVENWRARGAPRTGAAEVIEILYNALTHTFQSQLLLRHLVRALTIAGRYDEATKALRLYRELWDKARETDAKEVAREMRELRSRAMREEASGGGAGSRKEEEKVVLEKSEATTSADSTTEFDEPYAVDIDSDALFLQTAVFGVRLLCRYFSDRAEEAVDLARRARAVLDEGKDAALRREEGGRSRIEADVERSLGAALEAYLRSADPDADRRTKRHSESLEHLRHAVSLDSANSLNHFTLAYHLLEQRQVPEALDTAREAVRLDPTSKEAWHLLALCVSAQKDMRGALEVLETAIEIDSDSLADDGAGERRWDHPTDETERLAVEMQLRLTRNAVIEYLEGPAAALMDQQEILAYFTAAYAPIAAASAPMAQQQQPSQKMAGTTTNNGAGLAPPVNASLSRAASILSRRKSSKRKSQAPPLPPASGSAVAPIPPLHAGELQPSSSVLSTPARSVTGESTAASVTTAVSAASPSRLPQTAPSASTETINAISSTASARPSPSSSPLATKLLVDTWLASAASFRRAGKLEEARGAVSEAESLDVDDADVWTQLALVLLAQGEGSVQQRQQKVKDVLNRAMAIDTDHVPMSILLARSFLTPPPPSSSASSPPTPTPATTQKEEKDPQAAAPTWKRPLPTDWLVLQVPLAEAMLETLVTREGYDVPEAWFELSRCYQLTGRREEEKECLVRALELERTRPVRVLGKAVQRFV